MGKHTDRILELKSIYYSYHNTDGETPAITDLSFSVNESEFIAIVGPSGCGKSTLLSLISGLIAPEKGLIKNSMGDLCGKVLQISAICSSTTSSLNGGPSTIMYF